MGRYQDILPGRGAVARDLALFLPGAQMEEEPAQGVQALLRKEHASSTGIFSAVVILILLLLAAVKAGLL